VSRVVVVEFSSSSFQLLAVSGWLKSANIFISLYGLRSPASPPNETFILVTVHTKWLSGIGLPPL
jgi:hypothetical protein